jgi:hypothetical protein
LFTDLTAMNQSDMSGNYELYRKIDAVTDRKLTGEDPVTMEHGWSSHEIKEVPVVVLKCINWDERYIRIALWSDGQTATSSIPAVVDVDRKHKVALLADEMQWGLKPMEYASIEDGFGHQDKALINRLNHVLGRLEQSINRQHDMEVAKVEAEETLVRSFNDNSPARTASLIASAEQPTSQNSDARNRPLVDPLQQKALYQRLTEMFGDLPNGPQLIVRHGKDTDGEPVQDHVFVRSRVNDTHGIFHLYTVNPGTTTDRTIVAAFVVNFSTLEAQATPTLQLVKGFSLSLRAPDHCQDLKLESALGDLFPWGIKGAVEREEAYRFALGKVGEGSKTFYQADQKAFSSQKRMELFFNVTSDLLLQQRYPLRHQLNPEQGRSAIVRLQSQDGRERAVTLIGLGKNENPQDFMKAYLQQEQQIKPSAQPSLKQKLRRKWS